MTKLEIIEETGKIIFPVEKQARCIFCEPYSEGSFEYVQEIKKYKTKLIMHSLYDDTLLVYVCSNGHVFSEVKKDFFEQKGRIDVYTNTELKL